jgi:hypothetical protein
MAEYKYQHTIQKAYLEGFQAKSLPDEWNNTKAIWVLSLKNRTIRLRSIKRVSTRPYYYSFIDKNLKMNPLIEKWFQPIERRFIQIRSAIRDLVTEINFNDRAYNLNSEYRAMLAEYLHLNMIRVPKIFEKIKEQTKKFHMNLEKMGINEYDENAVQVTSLRGLLRVGSTKKANITVVLKERNYSIEFFPRSRVNIVTSDNPVVMYDAHRSPGLIYETTDVYFPIDSSIFLKLWGNGDQVRLVKHRDITYVDDINYLIGNKAHEEVYSADKVTLVNIAKRLNIEL